MDIRNLLLATAALVAALPAQEQDPTKDPASRETPPAAAAAPKKSTAQLIEALGSESYRARLDAERQLRELGAAAAPELEKAAKHSDDAEVQWRARRVLRLIQQGGTELEAKKQGDDAQAPGDAMQERKGGSGARRRSGGSDPVRDQFESLFERLNRDFGVDVPRARFFDDSFFRDLQEQMKDGMSRSQGMSMQIGPDGAVHVEVQEKGADGKVDKKVYDAPDMESFQKQYPGVLRQNGLGFGGGLSQRWLSTQPLRGFTFDGNGFQPWTTTPLTPATPDLPGLPESRDADVPLAEQLAPPPAGKRLGISIKPEVPAEVRQYLELDEGVGLMVEAVSDGSLAQSLGLQKGDIVTKIGARPIGSSKDVQEALAPIKKGSPVEVQIVRKGTKQTLKADKTEDVEDATKADKTESTDKPKLQKRRKAEGAIR